jgi:predicted O-methyltransferase YrrM
VAVDQPELVTRALALAAQRGFERSCLPEVGELLLVLAGRCRRALELGTGTGVGSAWLLAGLPADGALVTVEADAGLVTAAQAMLADPRVTFVHADWHEALAHGPYHLAFVDIAEAKREPDAVVGALAPGGLVVIDDLTPLERQPPERREREDPVRQAWLSHPALHVVELRTSAAWSALVAARRAG